MATKRLWKSCVEQLEGELSEQQLNTWIRPLHAIEEQHSLRLLAPNRFVLDWVKDHFFQRIDELVDSLSTDTPPRVSLEIGSRNIEKRSSNTVKPKLKYDPQLIPKSNPVPLKFNTNLNPNFTFDNFVEGKSNQLARASSLQVASHPGVAYNPLLIYGGVGLGKTHLMHAIGNCILENNSQAKVVYLHSERFVGDMVKALTAQQD